MRTPAVLPLSTLLGFALGTVTDLAYSVGFESLSYLRRAFHQR